MRSSRACTECGAPLAGDQHYCVECGTRATPLPFRVSAALKAIEQPHGPLPTDDPAGTEPDTSTRWGFLGGFEMPSPLAAAVTVLGTLAFGVLVLGSGSETLAGTPLYVAVNNNGGGLTSQVPTTPSTQSNSGGGGGSSSSSAPSSSASSSSTSSNTGSTTSTTPTTPSALPPV